MTKLLFFTILLLISPSVNVPLKRLFFPTTNRHLVPVLFSFYTDWDEPSKNTNNVLKDVATSVGDQGKVIKIDVEKNKQLADALRIKDLPTLILYKNGEM